MEFLRPNCLSSSTTGARVEDAEDLRDGEANEEGKYDDEDGGGYREPLRLIPGDGWGELSDDEEGKLKCESCIEGRRNGTVAIGGDIESGEKGDAVSSFTAAFVFVSSRGSGLFGFEASGEGMSGVKMSSLIC